MATAAALGLVAVMLGWRGGDLPAQLFRAELVRREGFTLWNDRWYGGHPTLNYSVLFPPLGAALGVLTVGIAASVVATACFHDLARRHYGPVVARAGALWFAVASISNLAVGRLTFALGAAFALAAMATFDRGHRWWALPLAVATPLASPVAGLFLALAAVTVAVAHPRRRVAAGVVAAAALTPLLVIVALFPESGTFGFHVGDLTWNLVVCLVVWLVVPREHVVVRTGAVLYALANVATFVIPSAMGTNVGRYGQYLVAPLLVCILWQKRMKLLAVLAVPLLLWQWLPAVDAVATAGQDPSTKADYHQPLLGALARQGGPLARVEIPFTFRHWESYYVALEQPLARGWERQLDTNLNPIFYDGSLTADTYHDWLLDNRVRWVALPDVAMDSSSEAEAALIRHGLAYLHSIWLGEHWQLWEVRDARSFVEGPATMVEHDATSYSLQVTGPGLVTVAERASGHWNIDLPDAGTGPGAPCVAEDTQGWTVLRNLPVGLVSVGQGLTGTPCPEEG